jgi:hypothetical protein
VRDDDVLAITTNSRGFEAFKAFEMWLSGSVGEKILGHGLGTPLDIGFYFDLGTDYSARYLPILHNAYFSVPVKFGVLSVGLFMTKPFRLSPIRNDPDSVFAACLGTTTAVTLLILTLTISGPLNRSVVDSITLLWGVAVGMQLQRHRTLRRAPQGNLFPLQSITGTVIRSQNT